MQKSDGRVRTACTNTPSYIMEGQKTGFHEVMLLSRGKRHSVTDDR